MTWSPVDSGGNFRFLIFFTGHPGVLSGEIVLSEFLRVFIE